MYHEKAAVSHPTVKFSSHITLFLFVDSYRNSNTIVVYTVVYYVMYTCQLCLIFYFYHIVSCVIVVYSYFANVYTVYIYTAEIQHSYIV